MHGGASPNRNAGGARSVAAVYDQKRIHVRLAKKARAAKASLKKASPKTSISPKTRTSLKAKTSLKTKASLMTKASPRKSEGAQRATISSSSPLGSMALHLLAQWKQSGPSGIVFLAENESRAERLGSVIHALDPTCEVLVFPRLNTLPFDQLEPSHELAGRRASVLRRLARSRKPLFLVSTAEAVMERLPPPASLLRLSVSLKVGGAFSERELESRLESLGYDLDDEPDYPGGALFHGQTFEIFPAGALGPFRIEHSDRAIDRIVAFDPKEHDIIFETKELVVDPMSERLGFAGKGGKRASLFDYCGRAKWIADAGVPAHADGWLDTIEEAAPRAEREREYLGRRDWKQLSRGMKVLPRTASFQAVPEFSKLTSARKALRAFVEETRRAGSRLILVAAQADDLRVMERMSGVKAQRCEDWDEAAARGGSGEAALLADLDAGFVVPGRKPLVVVTASDVLGSRAHHAQPMARAWSAAFDHADVPEQGTVVVHLQRGLAVLDGLQTVNTGGGAMREMIRLKYAGDNAVLVPPTDLALMWPYAAELGKLALDKADGSTWWARRSEAEREIQIAGKVLAKHISQRRRRRADKLVPPGSAYEKFVARFPYFTTTDQAKAIHDVLDDLASGHPMDRVVCGDVGFGKTEVALRAAAAVVLSGKQVAIAVPTTVLARQHVATFQKRFAPFGIEVGNLSRATSGAELRETREGLRSGRIKVVVGTQALTAKDVKFDDLGLVIIDEEQHFGAAEKAKLAGLAKNVHVLMMSATPIPRTLAAGLAGFRDLSVIASPPVHRLPVATRIAPLSDAAIASALLREQRRHGQSFLICPRIQDLDPMLARVQAVAGDLRIVCLHGRLAADEIDDRMMSFVEGRADVLLATNIVESGLDIPRANTIVVCWPEKFGLAQLHQLRGRVGRGGIRAFAHLLTETESGQSEKRLAVLEEFSRPGAGFAISERDLDLRGAGDLFSEQQSGHVQVFGPVLYSHLLKMASEKLDEERAAVWVPDLNLPVGDMLPETYVQSEPVRLELYARAARCSNEDDLEDLEEETSRRFGPLPKIARDFFDAAKLRIECKRRGIIRLDVGPGAVAATFLPGRLRKSRGKSLQRDGDRVVYHSPMRDAPFERVEELFEALDEG
ncbi:transcription-repair coupling factor (superfamily II helicase) [Bradyrhizobium huanghuaihaiense]|uniref:Transcription-repair-coupling factor n=2 Tax=Bradyrhizobium huanghuaihaiense TaxID=990078 RepID=A0A562RHV9_9BRAD|nr:transcription-repair coupling factor (superfamily II helicase) [Bradyrhizobium huanghuaihaiense]